MGPISAEIEIDAPRERVFALLEDLALRPSFTDHFLSSFRLTRIESRGIGAGARFRVSSPLRSAWMDTAILAREEPHRIVEEGRGGRVNRIRCHTVWELTRGSGTMTVVRVVRWTESPNPLDRGLEALSGTAHFERRGWREALRRLRDLLESEAPTVERIGVAGGNRHATGIA